MFGLHESETTGYKLVHIWLKNIYGKAYKCENRDSQVLDFSCSEKSKVFHWAKKKGFSYNKSRRSFNMLCVSCHRKYDFKEKMRMTFSRVNKGKVMSDITKKRMSVARMGRIVTDKTKEMIRVGNMGKFVSLETREKMSGSHKGKKFSSETRIKMRKAQSNRRLKANHVQTTLIS